MARSAISLRQVPVLNGALCAALIATGAHASSPATNHPIGLRLSKGAAILGGQPSALEAVLSRQGAAYAFTPAKLAAPRFLQLDTVRPAPSPAVEARPRIDAPASGRPDVLGTVALKLQTSRLDGKWRSVNRSPIRGRALQYARDLRASSPLHRINEVNRYVNRAVEFVADSRQYGRIDFWATASETLRRGKGDCEDYAIAKLQLLREAGFSDRDLYLVVARDLVRREDHAVLVARANDHLYMLDNGTDTILDGSEANDYRPIITFASSGVWTHGYRVPSRQSATIVTTANQPDVELALATDQRSRSASLLALSTGFSK